MDTLPATPEAAWSRVIMTCGRQVVTDPGVCSVEVGLAHQRTLAEQLADQSSAPALLVWRSRPALLVSRSEARLPRFSAAAADLRDIGWPVLLRGSGGAACPVGSGTVQVSLIEPGGSVAAMNAKYTALAGLIRATLQLYGAVIRPGLVVGAYCPGKSDLAVEGRKIAGMSQHWFRNRCGVRCVVTAASINIEEAPEKFERVVNQFYQSAGSPLRCSAAALTNLRLCKDMIAAPEGDLTAAVMNQIGAIPGRRLVAD
jgi:lipoate-protein ligase A